MNYSSQLHQLTTHALLHLAFFRLMQKPKRVPLKTANSALSKWLKIQQKRSEYGLITKDIKTLIIKCRSNVSVEHMIARLHEIETLTFSNDRDLFVATCRSSEKILDTLVGLADTMEEIEANQGKGVFIVGDAFVDHFSGNGELIAPLTLVFRQVASVPFEQVLPQFSGGFNITVDVRSKKIRVVTVSKK